MSIANNEKLNKHISVTKKAEINYSDLADSRIITKNLVYVIGLSSKLANKEILVKREYFGQYGTIVKIVVNKNKAYNQNNPNGPSYSAYVTYAKPYEASVAILSLDGVVVDEHLIRASFGTTK
jgi:CCR4-NOT transcription complex subunit 4